jgi:hypothetical protein
MKAVVAVEKALERFDEKGYRLKPGHSRPG